MFQRLEQHILILLEESVKSFLKDSHHPSVSDLDITIDIPKEKEFGDLSCNVAFKLTKLLRKDPKSIAQGISEKLKNTKGSANLIADIQVKSGFVNIFLKNEVFFDLLKTAERDTEGFTFPEIKDKGPYLLEFVSANPTGSLSVAHARQAAVGDALANLLSFFGAKVVKEYYLNDEGNQINVLGRSLELRYREVCGESIEFPEEYYQGQYITDMAREIYSDSKERKRIESLPADKREAFFMKYAVEKILNIIRGELHDFGVHFDVWYSQKELEKSGKIENVLEGLRKKGLLYDADGAVWFKSSEFGDDKDRVVRKSDGSYTYLAPDIAYHGDKIKRGFRKLINIWGPDHHGYVPRMKAAIRALGEDASLMDVIIVQLATLFRQGQPVPMSTRKGKYVTLREVLTEVGQDAARFFFLMRKTDSHLDFDLELAKKQTSENPVYYVQYAHARISGILAAAKDATVDLKKADLSLLTEPHERDLMKVILEFGYCLNVCVRQLDPYSLTSYLQTLSAAFHKFYDSHKVLSDNEELTQARLVLIGAVKRILAKGLGILGVSSPDRM